MFQPVKKRLSFLKRWRASAQTLVSLSIQRWRRKRLSWTSRVIQGKSYSMLWCCNEPRGCSWIPAKPTENNCLSRQDGFTPQSRLKYKTPAYRQKLAYFAILPTSSVGAYIDEKQSLRKCNFVHDPKFLESKSFLRKRSSFSRTGYWFIPVYDQFPFKIPNKKLLSLVADSWRCLPTCVFTTHLKKKYT